MKTGLSGVLIGEGHPASPPMDHPDELDGAGDMTGGTHRQPVDRAWFRVKADTPAIHDRRRLDQGRAKLAGIGIPEPDQTVPAAGRGQVAVVGYRGRVLPVGRAGELSLRLACLPVPEPYRAVTAGRDQPRAVAAESKLLNRPGMPAPSSRRCVGAELPPPELRLIPG